MVKVLITVGFFLLLGCATFTRAAEIDAQVDEIQNDITQLNLPLPLPLMGLARKAARRAR